MWTFPSIPASIMGQNVPGKLEPLLRVLVQGWIQDFPWASNLSLLFFYYYYFESRRSSQGGSWCGSSQSVTYPQLLSSHAFPPVEYCSTQLL